MRCNQSRRPRIALAVACASVAVCADLNAQQFYTGGDISLLPFIESRGGSFSDAAGVVRPADRIMVENGSNLFRLRLFVNPNTNYSATGGAIQNLSSTIALAQRLKASGAKILLDFHYSDTWADPGHQAKPAAWGSLSFANLNTTLRNYTRDSLLAMRDAGVMPEMVQVGNEITNGMLYGTSVSPPNGGHVVYTGSISVQNQSWMNFGSLLNSAISGVRDADAQMPGQRTQIAVHVDGGNIQNRAPYYFSQQLAGVAGVSPSSYDIAGMSFYPSGSTSLTNLQGNLNFLAGSFNKKVMVLETNWWWKDVGSNQIPDFPPWPLTPAGQRDMFVAVRDTVKNLPNSNGLGVVWWYPEAVLVPGVNIWQGGGISLFDDDTDGAGGDVHGALPVMAEFSLPAPTWNVNADGTWGSAGNWAGGIPSGAGQVARFGTVATSPRLVTLDSPRTVGAVSFLSTHAYTIGGATLTLDSTGGPASIAVIRGHHVIAAPVVLSDDTEVVTAWDNSLTVTGALSADGRMVTKFGSGTATFENLRAAALGIRFGAVKINPKASPNDPAGTSTVGSLSIAVGARLDLTNNSLVIDYTSPGALLEQMRQHLRSGRLTSSSANAANRLGYADNATLNLTSFAGQSVDSTSVLIAYTLAGDADLDFDVDATDLGMLATHWQAAADWTGGDFDYSGAVDVNDLALLARNWDAGTETFGESLRAPGCRR